MTPHDDEENWADLADALGIDTPVTQARKQAATPPAPGLPQEPPPLPEWARVTDGSVAENGSASGTEATAGEPAGEGEAEAERKRRRRRRRRRKPGQGEPGEGAAAEAGGDDEGDEAPIGFSSDSESAEDEAEPEPVGVGITDDPTPDAVRDLIANWNVPSWQEIVSGLYRPGGDR